MFFFVVRVYVERIRMQWHVVRASIVNDCEAGDSGARVPSFGYIQDKTRTKGTSRNFFFTLYKLQLLVGWSVMYG